MLISALLIVLGDRVDVQPDIASRVRHGRYRRAIGGAGTAERYSSVTRSNRYHNCWLPTQINLV
jgi:hypothetical protein